MNSTYLAKELESEAWIDFQDCDPFGHLNNARYLNYFMRARTEQLKASYGFDLYEHTAKTGNGWVVGETHLAYLLPAKFNETVKIKTRLLHYDSFRLVPEAFMLSQDGKRVHALGWIEFIYVNSAKGRPVKYDEALQSLFSAITTQAAALGRPKFFCACQRTEESEQISEPNNPQRRCGPVASPSVQFF
jgi:YbgC/YbaW family acyl-CoA thioester hydrolase